METKQVDLNAVNKLDEPIKADKWKNLLFTKDGRSFFGTKIYSTEQEAFKIAEECDRECEYDATKGIQSCFEVIGGPFKHETGCTVILFEDYSHTLQMPVK